MKVIPATIQGKIGISVLLALMVAGAVFLTSASGSGEGNGILVKLFLVFLGAIIAVQVIPGMLLFGAMVKAISNLTRKETVKEIRK